MSSRPEFGVSSSNGRFSRRGQGRRLGSTHANTRSLASFPGMEPSKLDQQFEHIRKLDELETRFNFERYQEGPERLGWLLNMHSTVVRDSDWPSGRAAVNFYFLTDNGETFKATSVYSPYFYIACRPKSETIVEDYLRRRFDYTIEKINRVQKEDLKEPNHLIGSTSSLLQLVFRNVSDLLAVRKVLLPAVKKNQEKIDAIDTYEEILRETSQIKYDDHDYISMRSQKSSHEAIENIIDVREYDIPYYIRVAIDLDIRVGIWYNVKASPDGFVTLTRRYDLVKRPDPVVLAFDIETTKLPLKFPDATIDSIMMISYMIDGRGYLITNREIVSQDIDDFAYTPKPEFEGPFTIFNEENELAVLRRFFEHIQDAKPNIYVTYNGDFFDWPFVEARAKVYGIDMYQEIGVYRDEEDEYKCKHASHMDAFRWVKRDSYLPQGSQGLKAVTTAKLGYNPMELDPEDMTRFAAEQPQTLAQYSVSDAVATYYLYMKYVHPFIFSLCNIIPLVPDEVLRKGSGTLCELLLMVEAYKANVIMPNKHTEQANKMFEGHLLTSETYVGGHVEALEAGVFRSDIATDFKVEPEAIKELIDQLDDALKFTIQVEEKQKLEDVVNYDEVKAQIQKQLEELRDHPIRQEQPLIYHLDVAAMYPNIILTNRLQPDAMIEESMCATCEFNKPGKTCDRRMVWSWRGEYFPAKLNEYKMILNQLSVETFPPQRPNDPPRSWISLTSTEQGTLLNKRLSDYCKKVYKKVHETKTITRESIICQRENPFYIETVRAFRDRRYEYKGLHKKWKGNLDQAVSEGNVTEIANAKNMIVLYDSLQLAHKCILNSFYGYVMRKGARWHSLEMAGIVCLTGATIIQMARQLVERIGRPLELDTDGIWCILPKSFPETFSLQLKNGKKCKIYYPCTMLNHLVHAKFTNHQYQTLVNRDTFEYSVHSENSIFFEIDGPYRAMILPSSTEEDKLLKKRYAVFNDDGSLGELKGFEVKRRGELKLIKIFQSELFKVFLEGQTLEECYAAVAGVANQWLDVLYSKGADLNDEELFDLLSENRSMSKTLEDYGSQKSTAISTAKRLAEFLGDQMVKDKGLACKFIISAQPAGLPVSERAIPVAIFSAEPSVKKHFLRTWLRDNSLNNFDIRSILDWPYYLDRFGSVIQKLITIPAAMQKVRNPVPRVRHPDWLHKRVAARDDKFKQHRITDMFTRVEKPLSMNEERGNDQDVEMEDIEDFQSDGRQMNGKLPKVAKVTKRKLKDTEMDLDRALADEDLPENMPDMYSDYQGFLEFQKRKWKRQRAERKKRRELQSNSQNSINNGVDGYFRRQTGSVATSTWEILSIAPTDLPGQYRMWVSVQGQLYCHRLSIPRMFYLNSREKAPSEVIRQNPTCTVEACSRLLPRSRPSLNLFQVIMPEDVFQDEQKKFSNIFNHPSTEGVYESNVPLDVRAILELGTCCAVVKSVGSSQRSEDRYDLLDLVPQPQANSKYLSNPKSFHYVFLYHAQCDSRHYFTLVGATMQQQHIFVVGPRQLRQQMPNVNQLYKDRYNMFMEDSRAPKSDTVELKADVEFVVDFPQTERAAFRGINKALGKYKDLRRGPAVLVVVSPRTVAYLGQQANIINEFPCLQLPSLQEDNQFDALNWLTPVTKRMLMRYMEIGCWVDEKLEQARYANIPFCNLPQDSYQYMADITFARRLIRNDMVLWWSPGPKPDLGGREDDENIYITHELVNTEINHPGVYDTVCVELDILRLCLNTIMESPTINELEGTSGVAGFDNVQHTLDEYNKGGITNTAMFGEGMISGKTFTTLRQMVQQWFHEAALKSNKLGDMMLETLHRWLLSASSNMYDPCLYGLVHGMMKKVFVQLVTELRRIGGNIVFANFRRIIVATAKDNIDSAIPFCEYLHRSVLNKQLFEVLGLELGEYWDILVWMDEQNYGGLPARIATEDGSGAIVRAQWNIQAHLPIAVQNMFRKTVASYIQELHQCKAQYPRLIGNQFRKDAGMAPDPRVRHMQQYIKQNVMRIVLRWLPVILRKQRAPTATSDPTLKFPQLSGSHLNMSNPAFEYVKFVCAVLGLDKHLEDEVRVLKRNALQTIGGVSDFSPEAQFRNPCEYFKLNEVICSYCNASADLDFCRDQRLMPVNDKVQPWQCSACGAEYNKQLIEERMIEQVQRWLSAYQLQDLSCPRCRSVKRENLRKLCDRCGSQYKTLQNKNDLLRKLRMFRNVAKEQQLLFLFDVVEWSLARL
ncbi:DNA polymerase epsilon catalytic subunit [Apophysomyces ossiformis]|uniref:DNA polymerase epsilon catalytic subunit n=1 Tax=Apophysomyces ossiformis TaxID=679940 RepID=A0A8H7EPB8_9FUNG|nr:DNA polymerase epsilon catalytic subunit [Apophysomyces ossiformis]